MRSAFNKDILREIQRTMGRFMSIMAIVALGVAFYAGLGATGNDMQLTGDAYFDAQNLMDIRVISSYGLTEKDVSAIRGAKGVEAVYPAFSMDAVVQSGDDAVILKVHSLDTENGPRVNIPVVRSGRLPEKDDEVAVEASFLRLTGKSLGETVELKSGKDTDIRGAIRHSRFIITAVVESPYYISRERGSGGVGSGKVDCFAYIPRNNFYADVYSEAYVTVTGAKAPLSFGDGYKDLVDGVVKTLEDKGEARSAERLREITGAGHLAITAAREEALSARAASEASFAGAYLGIETSRADLGRKTAALALNENELEASLRALAAGRESIASGLEQLRAGLEDARAQRQILASSRLTLLGAQAHLSAEELTRQLAALDASLLLIDGTAESLAARQSGLSRELLGLDASEREIKAGLSALADARRELSKGLADLRAAENETRLAQAGAREAFAALEAALTSRERELGDLDEVKWYVLKRGTNAGYAGFSDDSDKIRAIGVVFPLIFFIVAALVCLTTMTRLVEERRGEIGALKSLGYGDGRIMSKYIIYALVPTLAGALAGGAVGMKLFPQLIITAYAMLYTVPPPLTPLDPAVWGLATVIALMSTVLSSYFACKNELRETPCNLMRPRAPKMGKRILLEKIPLFWRRMNFSQKVTLRNIFRYKKRFFMTILGISGCTALLLTGFGLRDSITGLIGKQYSDVFKYDMVTQFTDSAKDKDLENIAQKLAASPVTRRSLKMMQKSMDAGVEGGKTETIQIVVPENPGEMGDYISLHRMDGGQAIPFTAETRGAVITEKLSQLLNLRVGGTFTIKDSDDRIRTLTVAGITENYFLHFAYIPPALYAEVFGGPPEYNVVYTVFAGGSAAEDQDALAEEVLENKAVSGVLMAADSKNTFIRTMSSLDFVVVVLIISAGALAFVVLLNLTSINISERVRELATIKVLGFYDKEVASYIYRENILLTVMGALAGLVLGIALHRYVILTAETSIVMFVRAIAWPSFIYAVALTIVFALCVNFISDRSLGKINMVEALKSVE